MQVNSFGTLGKINTAGLDCSEEKVEREVGSALAGLSQTIDSLGILVATLGERLEPVTRQVETKACGKEIAASNRQTSLGRALEFGAERIEDQNAYLRALLDRLEL